MPASRSLCLYLARAGGGSPPFIDTRSALHFGAAPAWTIMGDYFLAPRRGQLVLTAVSAFGCFYCMPTAGLDEVIDYHNTRGKELVAVFHKFQIVALIGINMAAFRTAMDTIDLALGLRYCSGDCVRFLEFNIFTQQWYRNVFRAESD